MAPLLKAGGRRRHSIRGQDDAGRLGGDEFAVVLRHTDVEAAATVARRIREGVEALRVQSAPGLRPTVSLGLAQAMAPQEGLRAWMEAADRALYRAKSAGRNRLAVHDGLEAAIDTP